MVKHYTVQTSNAFAALGDDSDSEEVILPLAAEAQKAPAAQQQQVSPAKSRREPVGLTSQVREGGAATREVGTAERRGPRREGEAPRRPRREQPRAAGEEGAIVAESERRPPRPAVRGPRQVREGKREFDRTSGTGRGTEIKREGGGSFNWGKPGEQDAWATQEAEAEVPESPKAAEAGEQAPTEQQPAQPKTFTYAQYKRQMEEKLGAPEDDSAVRAAELEAERQKAIKEGYTLYTKETKGAEREEDEERREEHKAEKGGFKTQSLAEYAVQSGITLNYGAPRRGPRREGEGRGPRREGEGRGPRREGEGRGPRREEGEGEGRRGGSGTRDEQKATGQQQGGKEINLVDNQAFPTLQAH